jgi:signal-transduction protein with cAMP-binding, CBS, and nucleotidyltransferase domain
MASKAADKLVMRVAPGDVIAREGEPGDEMFVIQKGKVRLTRVTGAQASEVGVLGKGDFFGEMCLLEGHARSESAEAIEPSEILRVNGLLFNKMITTNAEIGVRMLRKISARLKEANDKVTQLLTEVGRAPEEGGVAAAPPPPPAPVAPTLPPAALVVQSSQTPYAITSALTLIGRHDPVTGILPEIDLSKEEMGKSVSRRHAKIEFRDGQFVLTEEIGTLNNTPVNRVKLETGVMTPLIDGDEIGLGAVKLVFRENM